MRLYWHDGKVVSRFAARGTIDQVFLLNSGVQAAHQQVPGRLRSAAPVERVLCLASSFLFMLLRCAALPSIKAADVCSVLIPFSYLRPAVEQKSRLRKFCCSLHFGTCDQFCAYRNFLPPGSTGWVFNKTARRFFAAELECIVTQPG